MEEKKLLMAPSYIQFRLYIIKTTHKYSSFGKNSNKSSIQWRQPHREKRFNKWYIKTKQIYLSVLIKSTANCTKSFFFLLKYFLFLLTFEICLQPGSFFQSMKRICFSLSGHTYLYWSVELCFNQFLWIVIFLEW